MNELMTFVEHNLLYLKISATAVVILISYLFFQVKKRYLPGSTKDLIVKAIFTGMINAGIVILLGKIAFYLTPIFILFIFTQIFLTSRFKLYNLKESLIFVFYFILTSIFVFLGIAFIFFHNAVNGVI